MPGKGKVGVVRARQDQLVLLAVVREEGGSWNK